VQGAVRTGLHRESETARIAGEEEEDGEMLELGVPA
jgi:hypothetical protein